MERALSGGFVTTSMSGHPDAAKRTATFSIEWRGEVSLAKCDAFYDAFRALLEAQP